MLYVKKLAKMVQIRAPLCQPGAPPVLMPGPAALPAVPLSAALLPATVPKPGLRQFPSAAFTPPEAATGLASLAAVSDLSADQSRSVPWVQGIGSRSSMTQGCEDLE